jgi:sec-independent protein translocase protein TatA
VVGDILQPTHLLFILVVALLVLGPKRLPEIARSLGSGLRDFRAAINGEREELRDLKNAISGERDELRDLKAAISGERDERDTFAQPDTQVAGSGVADAEMQPVAGRDVSPPEASRAEPGPAGAPFSPEPEHTVAQPDPGPPQEPELNSRPQAASPEKREAAADPDPASSPDRVISLQHRD